jgi:phosphoglycerol transferase
MNKKTILAYSGSFLFSVVIVTLIMRLWQADFRVPFAYEWRDMEHGLATLNANGSGDALDNCATIKGMRDNGWFFQNRFVGAPGGLNHNDWPLAETLHFVLLKIISWFTPNFGANLNFFFLLGFPLTAWAGLYTFRALKISDPLAITGSLLYAFLPYHFLRGEQHVYLAGYYTIPLIVLVVLWMMDSELFASRASKSGGIPRLTRKGIISIVICILAGSSGTYYAFFGVFLLCAGALSVFLRERKMAPVGQAVSAAGVILATVAANYWPHIQYVFEHGNNPEVAQRFPFHSEIYGMKIIQLLLPVCQHRIGFLSDLAGKYCSQAPLVTENITSSLGMIGSVGFLVLLARILGFRWKSDRDRLLTHLGALNISCVLYGIIGGFGSLFAFTVSPALRCLNRFSVYIAFFSILTAILILEKFWRLHANSQQKFRYATFGAIIILLIGIADQTTDAFIPAYAENAASYRNDENFIKRIESALPPDAMVFQLPYVPYPAGADHGDYQLFKAYLHSRALRWSYGAMRGRSTDLWIRNEVFANNDAKRMIQELRNKGFLGIYVDRAYFSGHEQVENVLKQMIDAAPLESENHRLAFYSLTKPTP